MSITLQKIAHAHQQLADAMSPAQAPADDGERLHETLSRVRANGRRPVPRVGDPVAILKNGNIAGFGPPKPSFLSGRVAAVRGWDEASNLATIDVQLPDPPPPEPGTAAAKNLRRAGIPKPQGELLRNVRMARPGNPWRIGMAYPIEEVPQAGLRPEDLKAPSPAPVCGRCGGDAHESFLIGAARSPHEFLAAMPIGQRICAVCVRALAAWMSPRPAAAD